MDQLRGMSLEGIGTFDPQAGVLVTERKLPHWDQAGTVCFVTWRTDDSIPQPVLNRWLKERWQWLQSHGIDPRAEDWRAALQGLAVELRREFRRRFSAMWHDLLDQGHGDCPLRDPNLSQIVSESLQSGDGQQYVLTDFVVMPNHVHVLCAFLDEGAMLAQCESWKRYTATRINRSLGRSGRFWQQDGFDHLVRSVEQFDGLRRYLARNPEKANLEPHEFVHFSKPMPSS